ncbi:FimV/HubP family polar landmark protein [Plesiomonas sp.]|uniref:FimV/HubP family polar landmark protein n=1 Tax=Plesiomonas sp. TaxID=2486279 RepID=UPI003F3154C2
MITTKIARFIAIAVFSGAVMPATAYQMPVAGPESDPIIKQPAPTHLTQPAPIPRAATSAIYGPTRSNETLWSIASRVRPSNQVSIQQTIGALYRLNPSAFENNNLHGLLAGSRLRIPTLSQARAERTSVIASRLEREKPQWEAYTRNSNRPQTAVSTNTPRAVSLSKTQGDSSKSVRNVEQSVNASATNTESTQAGNITAVTPLVSSPVAETEASAVTPANSQPVAAVSAKSEQATPTGHIAERYQQNMVNAQESVTEKNPVSQNNAGAIIPADIAASMAVRAQSDQFGSQSLQGSSLLADRSENSIDEQLKTLRQQLVEANAELTLQSEKNLQLNNQVSALNIEMKSLQDKLTTELNFRQSVESRLAQADLQAKELAQLQVKHDMLISSSTSLVYQMSTSWPIAIAVGIVPPTIIGLLLWVLYRVRQRKQQDMLSQAFEEHQRKAASHPDNMSVLTDDEPDLNRSDELFIDPDWNAITASELNGAIAPDTNTTQRSTLPEAAKSDAKESSALHDDALLTDVPDTQVLPEPPSLFAGLDASIYSPSESPSDVDFSLSDLSLAVDHTQASETPDNSSIPEAEISAQAIRQSKTPVNAVSNEGESESQELALLVDSDLAHGDMLDGEQNLELGDDLVNVMLSTPHLPHGSPLDLDDDVHLLADSDDADSVLLLSDEELFESTQPLQREPSLDIPDNATGFVPELVNQTGQGSVQIEEAIATVSTEDVVDAVEVKSGALMTEGVSTHTVDTGIHHVADHDTKITSATSNGAAIEAQSIESSSAATPNKRTANINTIDDAEDKENAQSVDIGISPSTESSASALDDRDTTVTMSAKTSPFDLPNMTEEDFDLSTPFDPQSEHWSIPLAKEPQTEPEDWSAQPHLMDEQLSPEEREGVTQSFARALQPQSTSVGSVREDAATDDLVGKLILARAYLDIGDPEGAVALLNDIVARGTEDQQQQARKMLLEVKPR